VTTHRTIFWRERFDGNAHGESGEQVSGAGWRYVRKKAAPRKSTANPRKYGRNGANLRRRAPPPNPNRASARGPMQQIEAATADPIAPPSRSRVLPAFMVTTS